MDFRPTRSFSPLSGLEIKKAVAASLFQELDKHDFFSNNLCYPSVKWRVRVELELAPSVHAEPEKILLGVSGGYEQTDSKGIPVETGEPVTMTAEVTHESEFPDVTREQFLGEKPPGA